MPIYQEKVVAVAGKKFPVLGYIDKNRAGARLCTTRSTGLRDLQLSEQAEHNALPLLHNHQRKLACFRAWVSVGTTGRSSSRQEFDHFLKKKALSNVPSKNPMVVLQDVLRSEQSVFSHTAFDHVLAFANYIPKRTKIGQVSHTLSFLL